MQIRECVSVQEQSDTLLYLSLFFSRSLLTIFGDLEETVRLAKHPI